MPNWLHVGYTTLYCCIGGYALYLFQPDTFDGFLNQVRGYIIFTRCVLLAKRVFDTLLTSPKEIVNALIHDLFLMEFHILEFFFKSMFNNGKYPKSNP
jgi:hypothetical protein